MTSVNLNYQEKTILICQNLISTFKIKQEIIENARKFKELIFEETKSFPKSIALYKRVKAIADNNLCKCEICKKIHGNIDYKVCRGKCTIEFKRLESLNISGIEYEDYVECKICGYKNKTSISNHLLTHSITGSEYKEKFNVRTISV